MCLLPVVLNWYKDKLCGNSIVVESTVLCLGRVKIIHIIKQLIHAAKRHNLLILLPSFLLFILFPDFSLDYVVSSDYTHIINYATCMLFEAKRYCLFQWGADQFLICENLWLTILIWWYDLPEAKDAIEEWKLQS